MLFSDTVSDAVPVSVDSSETFSFRSQPNINPKRRCYRSRDLKHLASILLNYLKEDPSGVSFRTFMSTVNKKKQEALLIFLTELDDSNSVWWRVSRHLRAFMHDNSRGQSGQKSPRSLIKLPYISKSIDNLNISGIAVELMRKFIHPEIMELIEPPLFVYKYGQTSRHYFDTIKHWCGKPRQDLANFRCICHNPEFTRSAA